MEHGTLLKGLFIGKRIKRIHAIEFVRFHLYIVQGYASDCLGVDKDKNLGKDFDLFLVMGTGKYVSLCSPFINIWIIHFLKVCQKKN